MSSKLTAKDIRTHRFPVFVVVVAAVNVQGFLDESDAFQKHSTRRCSIKKVHLKISQNWQQNTYSRVSFLIKFQTEGLQRH